MWPPSRGRIGVTAEAAGRSSSPTFALAAPPPSRSSARFRHAPLASAAAARPVATTRVKDCALLMASRSYARSSWRRSGVAFEAMSEVQRLHILDGHGYIFRAHYGLATGGKDRQPVRLSTAAGMPTGALYVYSSMLIRLHLDVRPQRIAVVFDSGRPSFRSEVYAEYK